MNSEMPHPHSTVAVIGATGFIGSNLVDALLAAGYAVRGMGRSFPGLLSAAALCHPNFEQYQGDLSELTALEAVLNGAEICFHLASSTVPATSNLDPSSDVASNLIGSLKMLDVARASGVKRIVFSSSGGTVYGPPLMTPIPENHPNSPSCSYGIVKLAIEKYLALYNDLYGLDHIILRIANPYGERQRLVGGQGAVAAFLGRALRGEAIEIWGDGSVVRDYIYIGDVCDALIAAATRHSARGVLNIGSGTGMSLNELVGAISSQLGKPVKVNYHPPRSFDVPVNVLDIGLARNELCWAPKVLFREGLDRMHQSLQ